MSQYVLYRQKTKSEDVGKLKSTIPKFEELYKKYKIDMVGFWSVEGNESETYILYRYDSEEDYKTKFDLLLADSDYLTLRKEVEETRLSIEETRLVPMWVPE